MRCVYQLHRSERFASCVWRIHVVEHGVIFEEQMTIEIDGEATCMLSFWEGDPCRLMRAIGNARPNKDEPDELAFMLARCTTAVNRDCAPVRRTIWFSETRLELHRMFLVLRALPRVLIV